jgi:hypothetical protein
VGETAFNWKEKKKKSIVRKREKRKDKHEEGLRLGEVEFHEKRESDVELFGEGKKFSLCFEF